MDHLNNMKVSSLHADEPPSSSSSSSSSSYNGSEPIAEAENTTVDTAVLHRSLDYPNSTTLNETSDLDPSTLIQPQAKENTSNGNDDVHLKFDSIVGSIMMDTVVDVYCKC